ncbi:MAG: hypothetical protein ETSY1_05830 [Candidatus Entotheonella factor]|uniref:Sulfotransferase domain-containing protein n=1 Tax=Entotheonella factor TaxID=1429438 RepID=W4LUZ4_ENTF1|nr:sulfotransferase [Candidatus Entotheonella palauensis]ETX01849.1 MAG: hypothetical protein ETSY1_05830 [Candidatus Entotheonella factor]
MKPHFAGIGAQKAGTSWLHACLYEHPGIYMPASKEIHFFSKYYDRGIPWYEAHFRACRTTQRAGEFSPTYLYHPDAAQRLYQYHPDIQLIVCLREPVARTLSAYRYAIQTGALPPTMPLTEVLNHYPAYIEHSRYAGQLKRYLQFFSRQQMLIVFYEDIAVSPHALMDAIYAFLGIDRQFRPAMAERRVNASLGAPRMVPLDRWLKRGAAALRQAGFDRLVWRLSRSWVADAVRRLNARPSLPQPFPAETLAELHQSFAPDVHAIADLMGRDVPASWRVPMAQPTESTDAIRP